MGHHRIEAEAVAVVSKRKPKRNSVTDPAPNVTPDMLVGVAKNGKVAGYESGTVHKGTFYRECEGVHFYPDESFVRVIMFGDEFHDTETRIPLKTLADAGFTFSASTTKDAS